MLELAKKAWEETFYPEVFLSDRVINFFNGNSKPSFKDYFLEYPIPSHHLIFKLTYFIGLGFIIFPLKNVLKTFIEFPTILFDLTLKNLEQRFSFVPYIKAFFFIPKLISSLLCFITSFILSPTYGNYRVLKATNNLSIVSMAYSITSNLAFWWARTNLLDVVVESFKKKLPLIVNIVLPFANLLYFMRSAFRRPVNINLADRLAQQRFQSFKGFDPNTTLSSISMKPLGFFEIEEPSLHNVIMQYKESHRIKYAFLSEILEKELEKTSKSFNQDINAKSPIALIEDLQKKYPFKNFVQVPAQLTQRFKIHFKCPIKYVSFKDLNALPARTIYGHYYSKESISKWIKKNAPSTCPYTRLPLSLGDIEEVPSAVMDEELSRKPSQTLSTELPKQQSDILKIPVASLDSKESNVAVFSNNQVAEVNTQPKPIALTPTQISNKNGFFRENEGLASVCDSDNYAIHLKHLG